MLYCTKCGEELPDDANFCHKCGERTEKGIEESAPEVSHRRADWEDELEEAVSSAAKGVEEGLQAAFEGIRGARWGHNKYRVEEDKSYSGEVATGRVFFSVMNHNGVVKVSTWDKPEYKIDMTVKAWGYTKEEAEANLDELKIELNDTDDEDQKRLILDIERPADTWRRYSVDVDVVLPASTENDLDVSSSNGGISVNEVKGKTLKMSTSNGRLKLRDLSAELLSGKTSNGRITLDNVTADRLECRTSNGRIEGKVDAVEAFLRTSNGKVDLDLPCARSGEYELKTSNGSVQVNVEESPSVGFDLDLHTSMSTVRVNVPDLVYTRNRRHSKRAKTANYESKEVKIYIDASTSNGSVRVNS
ncbi:MAG: DUF4097 family beta strand repeat protein [Candidatus Bathyarchaeota archaeon]|nr:MAG: DUF4097 family beta strand repeat protein [Candidatus Bathyarchaeota archaeon]